MSFFLESAEDKLNYHNFAILRSFQPQHCVALKDQIMKLIKDLTELFKSTVNLNGYIDTENAERSIRGNIVFKGPNAWILAIAIIIASVGLNVNSIPVVIGAMLISPLMGPIFGLGLGLGVNDMSLVKASGKNLIVMVCISLAASFLYFLITPLSLTNPTELLARTNPTIYDVLIALFGGFAGIFEQCRKDKGTVFSGVAIATALMPPLCTAGFGLASGNFEVDVTDGEILDLGYTAPNRNGHYRAFAATGKDALTVKIEILKSSL